MRKPIIAAALLSLTFFGCGKKEPKPVVTEPLTPATPTNSAPAPQK